MPWFFYEWYPTIDSDLPKKVPSISPAQSLLKNDKNLTTDEKKYLLECFTTAFSFYEVSAVVKNQSITLKDLLTDEEHVVLEKSATSVIESGDFFFGKVITLDGKGILEAISSMVFSDKAYKEIVLDLCIFIKKQHKTKKIDNKILHEWNFEILECYQDIFAHQNEMTAPILTNTDGDLLFPQVLNYVIENPEKTFSALCCLCPAETKETLLEDGMYNHLGQLVEIEFPWVKKDRTVLGVINIKNNSMSVSLNSVERAKKFARELKKLMPKGWKRQIR
jgi:hypothetical protein